MNCEKKENGRRPRSLFTLVELLLALILILFVSNIVIQLFMGSLDITQAQVGTHQMYNTAISVMGQMEQDIRGMRTSNVRSTVSEVRLLGNFRKANDDFVTVGWPRMAFVTSFPEARSDSMLTTLSLTGGDPYDGYVQKPTPAMAPGGLKEVCYFTSSDQASEGAIGSGFLTLFKAVRSPIGTAPNLFSSDSTLPHFKRVIAKNVIYFGVSYLEDINKDGDFLDTDESVAGWDSTAGTTKYFPPFIEVTLSLASMTGSAQQEGVWSGGEVKMSGDNFKFVTPGYMAAGSKVRRYTLATNADGTPNLSACWDATSRKLKFLTCTNVAGCPAGSPANGDRVIFGVTFVRRFAVGQ